MASSRDITAASTASNSDVEDISENTTPSIRNRIACRTGDVLNNLTLSVWYSYALLFLQNVAGLSPTSVGILFFVSQILMAVTLIVIYLGYDKQLWKLFTAYGIQKARHVVSSAGILFAWPFAFTPCLLCGDGRSNLALGMYYLIPVVLLSVCWELAELSFSSLRKEIREGNDSEISRSITRVCKVCLYIVLWFLLQESKETSVNSNIKEQFAYLVLILLPVGFAFVFAFHLTVLEPRVQIERTRETNEREQLEEAVYFIPQVIIVCTTTAIFGTSLWYYLHTEERTSLVYAPTVIFASMSSLLTMVTPTLHQELTGNEKETSSFVHGVFECSERAILGVIVFTIQMFYPDSTKR
ncbi:Major facilitator superfamily domain-containing protein 12 [Acropora cervicornis]|uniref:Major facilitator superfamily domain-containing protein 12 n=1 Tax=Acropora cervicornis TaxID=6130 RepID=A0AAD9PV30_ACRCE|nr:Major facilitator superfamily domain-containing protein 12 [Acropora cervicornis]